MTLDLEILQTFSGLSIELTDELVKTHFHNCSQQYQSVIDDEIGKLLQKNVITRYDHEEGEIISPIFLKKKPDGSFRLIFNLKNMNKSIEKLHMWRIGIFSNYKSVCNKNQYATENFCFL